MEENKNSLPVPTEATVKVQMSVALTKVSKSIQTIQSTADSLVFNEDGLETISIFLKTTKEALKVVDEVHKEGKAPHLAAGKAWDSGKNAIVAAITAISGPVDTKYQTLCRQIEQRKAEEAARLAREKAILDGIEGNVITFSQKIAACTNNAELLSVERLINLEKSDSRKSKYGEFHELAIKRYDEVLIPILKDQKEKIRKKDELEKQLAGTEDAEKWDELSKKVEEIDNEIMQNKVDVQQLALNQEDLPVSPSEQIYPDVKGRSNFKFEIVDAAVALKKCPELLDITIKTRDAQKVAMAFRDAGVFNGKHEVVVNGIKYTIEKTYK